jgi:hypothetical protein
MAIFKVHACDIGGTTVGGIQGGSSIDDGATVERAPGDGDVASRFASVVSHMPMAQMASTDIAAVLAETGTTGADTSFAGYSAKMQNAAKVSGANSVEIAFAEALVLPRGLRASAGGNAEITFEVMGYSSSGGAPSAVDTTASLPSGAGVSDVWTLGPVSVNGTAINVSSSSVNFGLQTSQELPDGLVTPKAILVTSWAPSVSFSAIDVAQVHGAVAAGGTAIGVGTVEMWFRKRSEGGKLVADGTASHIKVTMTEGMVTVGATSGERQGVNVTVTPSFDGSNAIMQVSTGAAIS